MPHADPHRPWQCEVPGYDDQSKFGGTAFKRLEAIRLKQIFAYRKANGAVEKTRTSTGCPTATSTLRVYQFRHDRIVVGAELLRRGCM